MEKSGQRHLCSKANKSSVVDYTIKTQRYTFWHIFSLIVLDRSFLTYHGKIYALNDTIIIKLRQSKVSLHIAIHSFPS